MLKPPGDHRNYQLLTLDNGLEVLLVEDNQSSKSAASISVNVGHFDDPEHLSGLAHLLEHMLFLGTKSYPQAGELNDFLSQHGGQINGWTGTESSSYYFDINSDYFEDALARFAEMFYLANLELDKISKEKLTIDAEFKLKQKDDLRRLYQVHKETSNPEHPFSKFSVGNLTTLGQISDEELQSELKSLYQRCYLASSSKLVIVSAFPLDKQQQLAKQAFGQLTSLKDQRKPISTPLYLPQQLAVKIKVTPLSKASRLIITFALPNLDQYYKAKPLSYISHLLGHEGTDGLLSNLKSKGWVNRLSAGGGISGSNFKDFNINLQLTEEGIAKVEDIVATVFSYIALIKERGIEPWRFEEKQQLSQLAFNSLEVAGPLKTANLLAANMSHYEPTDYLTGDFLVEDYSPALINKVLDLMNPRNMRLKCVWQGQQTTMQASHYLTPYAQERISDESIERWASQTPASSLKLPKANSFVPKRFKPQSMDGEQHSPALIIDTAHFRGWHIQEQHFVAAKGAIHLSLDNPKVSQTARDAAKRKLLTALFRDAVNELNYDAEVAGLGYDVYSTQGGITFKTSGFSDNQDSLLLQLVNTFFNISFCSYRFDEISRQMVNHLINQQEAKPLNQLFNQLSVVLQPNHYCALDMAKELSSVDIEEIQQFKTELLASVHLEVFVHGDWPKTDAQSLLAKIEQQMFSVATPGLEHERQPEVINQAGPWKSQLKCPHDDSAIICYFQSQSNSVEQTALFMLFEQLISSLFFNQLRTEQQLGYVVGTGYAPINLHAGLATYVQSPQRSATELYSAIKTFFQQLPEHLEQWAEPDFIHLKEGLIHQLQERDTNFAMRNQKLWLAIANKDYKFNYQQRLCDSVAKLTLDDLQNLLTQQILTTKQQLVLFANSDITEADIPGIKKG